MNELIEMYLNYVNKFITTEKFAEWYGLDEEDAYQIIELGKKYHERKVNLKNYINELRTSR